MKKNIIMALALASMLVACESGPKFEYTEGEITRGDITTSVTATGTIEPVTSVQVGTQVSGIVSKLYVDYNSVVKAGQVIGLTGRTGRATTEHLHFETTFRGRRFNPNILFDHANRKLQQSTLTLKKNGSLLSKKN